MGFAQVVLGVKEIINSLWDRVVFFRQEQISANFDLIAQSLPLVERVDAMSQAGSINQQQAEIIKRKLLEGSTKFLRSGAITPEIEVFDVPPARKLMRPEQRLLAAPIDPVTSPQASASVGQGEDEGPEDDDSQLTREEIEQFKQLLRNSRTSTDPNDPTPPAGKRPRRPRRS